MAYTLSSALGSALKMNFAQNYVSGTGTWTDDIASLTATQATSTKRPVASTTPFGNLALQWDGVDDTLANATGFASAIGPTPLPRGSGGNGQRMWGCVFKTSQTGATSFGMVIYEPGSSDSIGISDIGGSTFRFTWQDGVSTKAWSNASVSDGQWHTLVLIADDTSGSVTMSLDGATQTQVGSDTVNGYMGFDWGFSTQAFATDGAHFWNGLFGNLFWAYTATTFSGTDIANVNKALAEYLRGPALVQSTSTGPAVTIAPDYLFSTETGSGTGSSWFDPDLFFQLDPLTGSAGALAGTTAVSVTAAGTLTATGALAGATTATLTATGALAGAGALVGATTATVTATGTITATGALAGTAALSVSATGTLTPPTGALAGTAAISVTTTGTLLATGALAGSTTATITSSGTATATGALAGAAAASVTASGTLIGKGALVGSATCAVTGNGTLTATGALAGAASASLSCSGALVGQGALSGSSACSVSASAALTGRGALAGTASVSLAASGTLTPPSGAMVGSSTVALSASGTLGGSGALAGASAVALSATGTASGAGHLAGAVAMTLSASATMGGTGALAGAATLGLSATGTLLGETPAVDAFRAWTTVGRTAAADAVLERKSRAWGAAEVTLLVDGVALERVARTHAPVERTLVAACAV